MTLALDISQEPLKRVDLLEKKLILLGFVNAPKLQNEIKSFNPGITAVYQRLAGTPCGDHPDFSNLPEIIFTIKKDDKNTFYALLVDGFGIPVSGHISDTVKTLQNYCDNQPNPIHGLLFRLKEKLERLLQSAPKPTHPTSES